MSQPESIGKWISALYRYLQMNINKELEQYNIGSGQYLVMLVLLRHDGINQERLAQILNLDKATIGRAISKLLRGGYVTRKRDPKDKRAYILYITNKGKKMEPMIRKVLSSLSTTLLTDFTENEKQIALVLLKRMYQNMTALSAK